MEIYNLMSYYFKILIVSLLSLSLVEFASCQEAPKAPKAPTNLIVETIGTITKQPSVTVPENLAVPTGHSFAFLLYARGDQLYQCVVSVPGQASSSQWLNVNVDSYFINELKDQHFDPAFQVVHLYNINPAVNGGNYTWEALLKNDTTKLTAKSVNTSSQGDANLPWELYAATQRDEGGRFSTISYVLRLNTNGGVAPPKNECGVQYTDKSTKTTTYEAEYWFYEGPLPGTEQNNAQNNTTSDAASSLRNKTPLSSMSIGPGQLGWIAIVGFVSVGTLFF